jgi:hypothetical protein
MAQRKRSRKSAKAARPNRPISKQRSSPLKVAEPETSSLAESQRLVSKQSIVITMLRQPGGASIAAVMAATGWQEHSVRGFFAAVVKKRFGLSLVSEKTGSGRVYRIEKADPAFTD